MPTNYQRGRGAEYLAIKMLTEVGFLCTRAAQSKGLFDVVAVRHDVVLFIQAKLSKLVPEHLWQQEKLLPSIPPAHKRRRPRHTTRGTAEGSKHGLLIGCAAHQLAPEATWSTLEVMGQTEGTVVCPKESPCCGALY